MVLGVCGVVSSITTAIPIHSFQHSLVVPRVVIAWLRGVVLFDQVWIECIGSHTQRKRTHTGVLVWHVVCHGVVYGVSERA